MIITSTAKNKLITVYAHVHTHVCTHICMHTYTHTQMCKYFHLQASSGSVLNMYATEALFYFKFELLGVQPCWFILYQRIAEKIGLWRQDTCATYTNLLHDVTHSKCQTKVAVLMAITFVIFNKPGNKSMGKTAESVSVIPFSSTGLWCFITWYPH